jgi:hypothetical protein
MQAQNRQSSVVNYHSVLNSNNKRRATGVFEMQKGYFAPSFWQCSLFWVVARSLFAVKGLAGALWGST